MIYRCMYRTSPKCLKFKSDQPYWNAHQKDWVCPMCADLTYRKFVIAETEPLSRKPEPATLASTATKSPRRRRLLEGFKRAI